MPARNHAIFGAVLRTPRSRVWVSLSTNRRYTADPHTPQDPPPHIGAQHVLEQLITKCGAALPQLVRRGGSNPSFATPACFRAFAQGFDLQAPSGTLWAPPKKRKRAVFRELARPVGDLKSCHFWQTCGGLLEAASGWV